jgi:hypothetical protein
MRGQVRAFQRAKRLDGFADLLLGQPQVVEALQIQPKLSTRAKEMSQAKGSVPRNGRAIRPYA